MQSQHGDYYRNSIANNIEKVLNCKLIDDSYCKPYAHAEDSILCYGIPSITELSFDDQNSLEYLCHEICNKIRLFEKRAQYIELKFYKSELKTRLEFMLIIKPYKDFNIDDIRYEGHLNSHTQQYEIARGC